MNRSAGYRILVWLLDAAVLLAMVMLAYALWELKYEPEGLRFRLWFSALIFGIASMIVRLPAEIRVLEIFIKLAALILVAGLWLVVTGRLVLS